MREWIRSHLTYANVMATIAVFIALGGGTTAVALNGSNTVQSDDLGPGAQVKAPDIADNAVDGADIARDAVQAPEIAQNGVGKGEIRNDAVGTSKVANGSLTGADVDESTLGQVPSALLGGYGRWSGGGTCNPPSGLVNAGPFVNCATVTLDLPAPARVLLMGQATGVSEDGQGKLALGSCRLGSAGGPFPGSTTSINSTTQEAVSPVAVSDVFQPGQHTLDIECNDAGAPVVGGGQIRYQEAGIVAVALSPN